MFWTGLAACLLAGFLLAPSLEGGAAAFLGRVSAGKPAPVRLTRQTPVCMLACGAAYVFLCGIMREETGHFRQGEEHGSAQWADPAATGRKYAGREPANKILTEHVKIGLDPVRHRRNLNTIVCGGSGAGKTRYFCIPNILQDAGCSLFVLDPKMTVI